MQFVFLAVVLLGLVFGPGLWVKRVLAKYSEPAGRYEITGGKLARDLLDHHCLQSVRVETAASGDLYDHTEKSVRLTSEKFHGHSLMAIAVAAHEVGHPHARRLLRAAAFTYVAASLMSLLNIARWWAILRR